MLIINKWADICYFVLYNVLNTRYIFNYILYSRFTFDLGKD